MGETDGYQFVIVFTMVSVRCATKNSGSTLGLPGVPRDMMALYLLLHSYMGI